MFVLQNNYPCFVNVIILPPQDIIFPSTMPVTARESSPSGWLKMEQLDSKVKEGSSTAFEPPTYITSNGIKFMFNHYQ